MKDVFELNFDDIVNIFIKNGFFNKLGPLTFNLQSLETQRLPHRFLDLLVHLDVSLPKRVDHLFVYEGNKLEFQSFCEQTENQEFIFTVLDLNQVLEGVLLLFL